MSDAFKREIDKGTIPGATVMVARHGQIGWFDALGRQSQAASAPMAAEHPLSHLLDDQTDRLPRHHDAHRRRPFPAQRPTRQVHSGICRPESRRREQWSARPCAREPADHDPGSAAAHFRHHLRTYRQQSGAAAVSAIAAAQPQDHQRRTRYADREPAADVPAGRRVELQPLDRHPRPPDRSRHRQDARRIPDRTHSRAAADGRDRVPHRRRKRRPSRRAVCDRSLDRRQGAALQHARKAGDGIRRRRSGLDHHGLCTVLPDAAQWRRRSMASGSSAARRWN